MKLQREALREAQLLALSSGIELKCCNVHYVTRSMSSSTGCLPSRFSRWGSRRMDGATMCQTTAWMESCRYSSPVNIFLSTRRCNKQMMQASTVGCLSAAFYTTGISPNASYVSSGIRQTSSLAGVGHFSRTWLTMQFLPASSWMAFELCARLVLLWGNAGALSSLHSHAAICIKGPVQPTFTRRVTLGPCPAYIHMQPFASIWMLSAMLKVHAWSSIHM